MSEHQKATSPNADVGLVEEYRSWLVNERALAPKPIAYYVAAAQLVVMLVRLGLRAGEVAGLSLDDIDWHAGEITVSGKGARRERLPLPVDVGEALVAYLKSGRPKTDCRALFLRADVPLRLSATGV